MIATELRLISRYWWILALRGLAAVIFGVIALLFPGIALLALIYIFAAYALIDGVTAVIVAIQERGASRRWPILLAEGLISIIFGILAFAWPGVTALFLLYLIAIWAIFTGVMEIAAAFMMRNMVTREWALGIAGALSIIFGILLIINPGTGIITVLWLLGIYAIVFGVLLIIRAFQFRTLASA
jgi:uncharacterized membrane protein HdeD (DUF308 family)